MNKSITFKIAFNPQYREEQKICGTLSLERSFADFLLKKNSHRSCLPLSKDSTRQLNFIHKSPKFAVSLLKLIKMWCFPLLLSIFTGSRGSPACTDPSVSVMAGTVFHGNQRKTNQ